MRLLLVAIQLVEIQRGQVNAFEFCTESDRRPLVTTCCIFLYLLWSVQDKTSSSYFLQFAPLSTSIDVELNPGTPSAVTTTPKVTQNKNVCDVPHSCQEQSIHGGFVKLGYLSTVQSSLWAKNMTLLTAQSTYTFGQNNWGQNNWGVSRGVV